MTPAVANAKHPRKRADEPPACRGRPQTRQLNVAQTDVWWRLTEAGAAVNGPPVTLSPDRRLGAVDSATSASACTRSVTLRNWQPALSRGSSNPHSTSRPTAASKRGVAIECCHARICGRRANSRCFALVSVRRCWTRRRASRSTSLILIGPSSAWATGKTAAFTIAAARLTVAVVTSRLGLPSPPAMAARCSVAAKRRAKSGKAPR